MTLIETAAVMGACFLAGGYVGGAITINYFFDNAIKAALTWPKALPAIVKDIAWKLQFARAGIL